MCSKDALNHLPVHDECILSILGFDGGTESIWILLKTERQWFIDLQSTQLAKKLENIKQSGNHRLLVPFRRLGGEGVQKETCSQFYDIAMVSMSYWFLQTGHDPKIRI